MWNSGSMQPTPLINTYFIHVRMSQTCIGIMHINVIVHLAKKLASTHHKTDLVF